MAKIVSFTNRKGGVGKSTSAMEIAYGLSLMLKPHKRKVLLIDTDSQAHTTMITLDLDSNKLSPDDKTLYTLMRHYAETRTFPDVREAIHQSHWAENLHVLPAQQRLNEVEKTIGSMSAYGYIMEDLLKPIQDDYAVIVIDTSPSLSPMTEMSLVASDQYIIPVTPAPLDSDGLIQLINDISTIRTAWRLSSPDLGGILVTKFARKTLGHNEIRDFIRDSDTLGKYYLGTVPINIAVEYAQGQREPVISYKDGNTRAAVAYAGITNEYAQRLFKG